MLGRRDAEEAEAAGSQRVQDVAITVIDLPLVRRFGASRAARRALGLLSSSGLDGFWIQLDCDVLDDAVMPAVDYRLPGGGSRVNTHKVGRLAQIAGATLQP